MLQHHARACIRPHSLLGKRSKGEFPCFVILRNNGVHCIGASDGSCQIPRAKTTERNGMSVRRLYLSRNRLLRLISNSPARTRHSAPIYTYLSSRARLIWRSFFLPFYRPTHSLCACLSSFYDMSHSIQTFLLFFYWVLKGYINESNIKSSDRHIQEPTDHFCSFYVPQYFHIWVTTDMSGWSIW